MPDINTIREKSGASKCPTRRRRGNFIQSHPTAEEKCEDRRQTSRDIDAQGKNIARLKRQKNQSSRNPRKILDIRPERGSQRFTGIPLRQEMLRAENRLLSEADSMLVHQDEIT